MIKYNLFVQFWFCLVSAYLWLEGMIIIIDVTVWVLQGTYSKVLQGYQQSGYKWPLVIFIGIAGLAISGKEQEARERVLYLFLDISYFWMSGNVWSKWIFKLAFATILLWCFSILTSFLISWLEWCILLAWSLKERAPNALYYACGSHFCNLSPAFFY